MPPTDQINAQGLAVGADGDVTSYVSEFSNEPTSVGDISAGGLACSKRKYWEAEQEEVLTRGRNFGGVV